MKTTEKMKWITFLILMVYSFNSTAQSTYLKFTNTEKKTSISYAPNTKFEVKNKHGYIQMKDADSPYQLKIDDEGYTLTVYPSYKNGKDVYTLNKGAIIERIIAEGHKTYNYSNYAVSNTKVTGTKKVTKSFVKENKYNLEFELSNGITFTYKDGEYTSTLNDKKLEIDGKYVIESKLGTLKISFNPRNGETWWVFEENE